MTTNELQAQGTERKLHKVALQSNCSKLVIKKNVKAVRKRQCYTERNNDDRRYLTGSKQIRTQ